MRVEVLVIAAFLAAGPALAQETKPAAGENVVVTADERQETFEKQRAAERAATDARRLFAEVREGRGDRALACRTAAQADRDYVEAIQEARQLAKDAAPALQQSLEARIKGMTERRGDLDDIHDRVCDGPRNARGPGGQGARTRGRQQ